MLRFLKFSPLKPNEKEKSNIVTLYMTFERILMDFKVSYLAKTQVLLIALAQVPAISQLYNVQPTTKEKNVYITLSFLVSFLLT